MPSEASRSFGPYEVIAQIGQGGMGQVFKARDTRLDRIVALKTSQAQFSDRFAKEARATAALNHPHIATLYDVGPDYLVMEFVDGETLRGPLPVPRALLYARQILEALEAAHRKGIVHRDLKPANIMIARSGVKLLDFGLAQIKAPGPTGDQTATMALSTEGTIVGTLQYMSPEQLQGREADPRSDIFAFGLVLYEMLSGRRAFDGDNAASVISAIMTSEPPPLPDSQMPAPPALARVLQQCIAKDPDDRWQSAADIRRALDLVEAAPSVAGVAAAPVKAKSGWGWIAAAAVCGALITAAAFRLAVPKPAEPWTFRPLTYAGIAVVPSLSPDGKQVAFLWTGGKARSFDLYLQLVNGGNPLRLPDAHPASKPAWAPDGSRLAFLRSDGGIYVMPALGGPPQRVSTSTGAVNGALAWSPNGGFFVFSGPGNGLYSVPTEGGEARQLTRLAMGVDISPSVSPDSRMLAFVRRTSTFNSAVLVMPVSRDAAAGGQPKQITTGVWDINNLDWTADGREVLFEGSAGSGNPSLWRIPYTGGKPIRFQAPSINAGQPTIARQSDRMSYRTVEFETKIFKMPLGAHGPGESQAVIESDGDQRDLGVAADGSRIVFVSNRTGSKEIWIANRDGSNQTQLTFFKGPAVGSPRWSPDGKQIAFDGYAGGSSDIYLIPVEGGKPVQLTRDKGNEIRPSWSHDGQWIYFGWDKDGKSEIWKIRPAGGQPAQVTRHGGYHAFESPDGKWLYVNSPPKLSRMRPDGGEETPLRHDVDPNMWYMGERHVYWVSHSGDLMRAPAGESASEVVHHFDDAASLQGGGTAIALPRDESYLIYRRTTRGSSKLMLIENFR